MQAQEFRQMGGVGPEETDLAGPARELSAAAVTAFAAVTEELTKIRTFHGEISSSLSEFADLVQSAESVSAVLADLQTQVDALAQSFSGFAQSLSSPETKQRLKNARSVLTRISGNGRSLKAIATLSRTTAASLGVSKMESFVQELKQTAAHIHDDAEDALQNLNDLHAGFGEMGGSCQSALSAMSGLPSEMQRGQAAIGSLEHDEARAAAQISARALKLIDSGKANLKIFVSAMQFSDRLAQRLDHLALMVDFNDKHVNVLAEAQARDCKQAIQDVSDEVRQTMQDMARLGHDGAALFSEGAIADLIAETMQRRAEMIDKVRAQVALVDALLEDVQANAERIADASEHAHQSIGKLTRSAEGVSVASVNSLLLATRIGDLGTPLIVLSKEVRQTADQCLEDVRLCQQCVDSLTHDSGVCQDDLSATSARLSKAIEAHENLHAMGESRLNDINALRTNALESAQTLLALVDDVNARMVALDDVGDALLNLPFDTGDTDLGVPDNAHMEQVWALYTMEEERSVHRSIYPNMPPEADVARGGAEVEADGDDLDDLLF